MMHGLQSPGVERVSIDVPAAPALPTPAPPTSRLSQTAAAASAAAALQEPTAPAQPHLPGSSVAKGEQAGARVVAQLLRPQPLPQVLHRHACVVWRRAGVVDGGQRSVRSACLACV